MAMAKGTSEKAMSPSVYLVWILKRRSRTAALRAMTHVYSFWECEPTRGI